MLKSRPALDFSLFMKTYTELQRRLFELQKQKKEMEDAFSKEAVSLRIYGESVEMGKVSSRVLLAALGGFQSMLDSVANAILHSPTSRGKIPEHIKDNITGFEVVGTFAGSFGVRLERQVPQSGMASGDTDISRAMNEMFNIQPNNLDYLCKALKNRHFRGYGQPNLLPIYYFWGKSLDMRSTARASRPEGQHTDNPLQ